MYICLKELYLKRSFKLKKDHRPNQLIFQEGSTWTSGNTIWHTFDISIIKNHIQIKKTNEVSEDFHWTNTCTELDKDLFEVSKLTNIDFVPFLNTNTDDDEYVTKKNSKFCSGCGKEIKKTTKFYEH